MKQKKINDILYVFDFTPYEITQDTDADVIKVQEESYAGFIALNESLADKIVKYNYNMMTVQPLEWAPYIESKEYEFTISGWNWEESITVTIDDEPQEVLDSYELYEGAVIEIAPVDGNSIYDYYVAVNDQYVAPEDDKWTFTMESPEGIAVTVGYGEPKTIYFDATNITSSNLSVNSFGVDLGIQSEYTLRTGQNTLISFAPTEGSEEYTASDNMIWNADQACWEVNYYNIEDDDTISLEYNGQPVVSGHTLTLDGDDIHSHVSVMFDGGEVATQYEYNDIAEGTRIEIHPTDDPSNYTLVAGAEWDANSNCWTYTMGVIDWTITINYTEPVSTIMLTAPDGLAILDEEWSSWVTMDQDLSDPSLAIGEITPGKTYSVEQRNGIGQGMDVTFSPACGTGQQGTVGAAFIAPNEDLTITLSQPVQALADPELAWSANSATVTIGADDNVFPTLINPNEITSGITYESTSPEIAEINAAYGEIILVQSGETTISAIFEGDETYSASTVSYDLTVENANGPSGSSGESGQSGE